MERRTIPRTEPGRLPGATDPTCDHFIVRVDSPRVKRVFVAITPNEGFEEDDYDLFVYDDQGKLVGSNADGDGFESVIFENSGRVILRSARAAVCRRSRPPV